MFKLESYITPIILSYVEKYAKNLKAESSQFSLWGGDAVFSNLDLRLDVLERELNIPFTFVSGHIHELHIHVPWTRLHADPIVITINTIECVLRLPGDEDSSESPSAKRPAPKRIQEDRNPPPGYVQSLINKIISNVSIVCNNLILKYVEEDIVLSLNTRSVKLSSCDESWNPAFIELSLPHLLLRKILDVYDLTICLDKRNASGKIECYMEPLLYRCSLKVHVAWIYDSLNAKSPRVSRFEMLCPKLEFSVTEIQLPMLLRLFHLGLALYFGKINEGSSATVAAREEDHPLNEGQFEGEEGASWSGWAWDVGTTVGSALLPIYWDDEDEDSLEERRMSSRDRVLHLGLYVDTASVDLKLMQISREKRFFGSASRKQSFAPYIRFGLHGIFGEVFVKGMNAVNLRSGVNVFEVIPLGTSCPCGASDKMESSTYIHGGPRCEDSPEDKKGSHYLRGSLFDQDRGHEEGVPLERRRSYDVVWDAHMEEVTEEALLERSSAFAMDYLYFWEIPSDLNSEQLSEICADLEYSNLSERALLRAVLGPFVIQYSTGFRHRIDLIQDALKYYDYCPYYEFSDRNPFVTEATKSSMGEDQEETELIQNGSIPVRVYQVTAIQPCFVFYTFMDSKRHSENIGGEALRLSMGYIDLTYTTPMYPFRCAKAVARLDEPRPGVLHSSAYASLNANFLDVSSQLVQGERSVTLLTPFKLKGGLKRLLFSSYWKWESLPHWELSLELNSFKLRFTKPQILLLGHILSLLGGDKGERARIAKDSFTKRLNSLVISISGTKAIAALTASVVSLQLTVDDVGVVLLVSQSAQSSSIPILSRETREDLNKASPGRASIKSESPSIFILQWPKEKECQSNNATPPIVFCNVTDFYVNFDPSLYAWLEYSAPDPVQGFTTLEEENDTEEFASTTISSEFRYKKKNKPSSHPSYPATVKAWLPSISMTFIQIKTQGIKAFFPFRSLPGVRSVKEAVKRASPASSSDILLKVSFPKVSLENKTQPPVIQQFLNGFPILLPKSLWDHSDDNLPLKLKLNDFYIQDEFTGAYFLEPNQGFTSFLDLDSFEKLSLTLSMHLDAAESFKFRVNSEYLFALTEVVSGVSSCLQSLFPLKDQHQEGEDEMNEGEELSSSYITEPISSMRSQSGLFDSGRLLSESSANLSSSTLQEDDSKKSGFCFNYWFQCTFPSVSIVFQPLEAEEPLLHLEMEDVMACLDVQPHYTKLKSRVMAASMRKSDGCVVLTTGEDIAPEIKTTDGSSVQIIPHSSLYDPPLNFSKHQGVFNFTFVKALISNAKWRLFLKKSKALIANEEGTLDDDEPRFLSEVYIKLSPLDIAVSPLSLSRYLRIFSKSISNLGSKLPSKRSIKKRSTPMSLWLNNNNLPLLHIESKSIRLFLRKKEPGQIEQHDTFLFHLESLNVSSNVENALSRLLIRPDLYYLAEQCEVLSVMGSKIEDRQYSASLNGFGIYTGSWRAFEGKCGKDKDFLLKTMEENPALKWNISHMTQRGNDADLFFLPVLKQSNLQITYAPAIVYYSQSLVSKRPKTRLIAGHSLELNAVSDINFYVSLAQTGVVEGILRECLESFGTSVDEKGSIESSEVPGANDSGCDISSHGKNSSRVVVPLEVLVTGSKVSCFLYKWIDQKKSLSRKDRYRNRKIDVLREQDILRKTEDDLPPLDISPNESLPPISDPEERQYLSPLLYLSLRQPHIFMSITRSTQKLELSLYDLAMNSSSSAEEGASLEKRDKYSLPQESSFPNPWVETKQGDSDPLSGIPPALFTATLLDFLSPSHKLSIHLDRPFKLNIDEKNILRGLDILNELKECLPVLQSSSSKEASIVKNESYLSSLSRFSLSTRQVLLYNPIEELYSDFFLGFSSLGLEMRFLDEYETSKMDLNLANVSLRSRLRGNTARVLSPWSLTLESDLTTPRWAPEDSMISLKISSKPLLLDLGPNTALALYLAFNYYRQKRDEWEGHLGDQGSKTDPPLPPKKKCPPSPEQHYSDDLRAGAFKYMTSNPGVKGSEVRPYQVIFSSKTLTWRYPQPRALTRMTVFPVPLLAASDLGRYSTSTRKEVHGLLQYWDLSLKSFRTYSEFSLSESEIRHLNLPLLSDRKRVAVSPIWRVSLSLPSDSEEDYVLLEEEEVIVTAKSLVSVLKVDSFFSPELIPKIQISGNLSSLSLRLHNHFHFFSRELPSELQGYYSFQPLPLDQVIFTLHLNTISFGLDHWVDRSRDSHIFLRLKSSANIVFIDHKFLNTNTLLSPTKFQTQIYALNHALADLSLHSKPLHLRLGHFLHHSLQISSWVWGSLLKRRNSPPPLESLEMPLLSAYVICNQTQSVLKFGQSETSEAIVLNPRDAYMYTWRSSRAPKALQLLLTKKPSGEDWSEPFSLDHKDGERKKIGHSPISFIIHFSSVGLSRKITLSGLISTASLLQEPLEIKLVPKKAEEDLLQQRILLSPYTSAPSIVMDPEKIEGIKIRILGIGLSWSGTIPTEMEERRHSSALVRVPTKDKESVLTLWCRVVRESYGPDTVRVLYIFSPMYTARSLLPNPMATFLSHNDASKDKSNRDEEEVTLPGRDSIVQFQTHKDELKFSISFKICPELPASQPVPISWGLVEKVRQLEKENPEQSLNIDDVISGIPSIREAHWISERDDATLSSINQQPKTDVQITFVQLHPLCNTLCVEVRPSILIINELRSVHLLFKYEGNVWNIAPESVFVPPLLSSTFHIGISEDGEEHFCSALELSNQDWNIRQLMPTISGSVPLEGNLQIKILVREDYNCFLTLCSGFETKRGIRVLRIKSTFSIIQKFPEPLSVASLSASPDVLHPWMDTAFVGQTVQGPSEDSVALLYWQVIGSSGLRYLSLSENGKNDWSIPVCLDDFSAEEDQRRFIDFPIHEGDSSLANMPLTLTLHKRSGVFYLVLLAEERPFLMVHNHLNNHFLTLKYVFKNEESNGGKGGSVPLLSWVSAGKSAYFPLSTGSQTSSFKLENEEISFIFAATESLPMNEESSLKWSQALSFDNSINEFSIHIPDAGDAKLIIEELGYTTHIYLNSICEDEEIHAKDVRARINVSEEKEDLSKKSYAGREPPPCTKENKRRELVTSLPYDLLLRARSQKPEVPLHPPHDFQAYIYLEELSFTLSEDTFESNESLVELLRLTLDSVSLTYRPRFEKSLHSLEQGISRSSEVCLTIFQIQLDNQLFKSNRYDFGIIAVGKSSGDDEVCEEGGEILEDNGVSYRMRSRVKVPVSSRCEYVYEELKKNCMVLCSIIFDGNMNCSESFVKSISLSVQPMYLNLEDVFFYKISEVLGSFHRLNPEPHREVDSILASSSNIAKYLRLESLIIEPMAVSVSIRAFVKMHIGVHESPLNFGSFALSGLNTSSSYDLGSTIARHYISGTLFKAGWVLGSLDILGSPTGFTRTVSDGVRDLIAFPYEGSFRGPWAFISGVVHGSSSLVKHVTAGTLTSVTNFASSVSRNLDRLSLDSEHTERNEISRRSSKPSGLGQGILFGLSGVGIGILGAIGGIAHHPLQALIDSGASPSGLLGGVTRGLAGVVTKPLGSAAEFVALTGQGILRGTGWRRDIHPRSLKAPENVWDMEYGELHYTWKILGLEVTSVICLLNALGDTEDVTLLLTSEAVFLVSLEGKVTAYALLSLELNPHPTDPNSFSLLHLESFDIDEEERHKYERVTQFVLSLSGETPSQATKSQFDSKKCLEMNFSGAPLSIEVFISLFELAKRQKNKKGFVSL